MVGDRYASYQPYYRHLCAITKVQSGEDAKMRSSSFPPSGTSGVPRSEHHAFALFIGSAGGKKPYYLPGPTETSPTH